jgi:hypothetical protein
VRSIALGHALAAYPLVVGDLGRVTLFGVAGADAVTIAGARGEARGHRPELAAAHGTVRTCS